LNEITEIIFEFLANGSAAAKIRTIVGTLVMILLAVQYLKIRSERKKITEAEENETIEKIYEKNEDGLYPWEIDQDDSPKRITKDARRFNNEWAPQRGRWR
jgi:hypothetical protein